MVHPASRRAGEELRRGVDVAAGGDGDELVELAGDDAGVDVLFPAAVALRVEAGEQRHGQAVVETVALAPDLAVADDQFDAAVKGARSDLVGDAGVGELFDRRVPGEREGAAAGAVAQRVGALPGHPRRARRILDAAALREGGEEGGDPLGRPAVVALGAAGVGVGGRMENALDGAGDEGLGDARRAQGAGASRRCGDRRLIGRGG